MNFLNQSLLWLLQKLRMVKNFATDPKHFAIFYLRIHYMQGVLLKNTEEYFEHAEYE